MGAGLPSPFEVPGLDRWSDMAVCAKECLDGWLDDKDAKLQGGVYVGVLSFLRDALAGAENETSRSLTDFKRWNLLVSLRQPLGLTEDAPSQELAALLQSHLDVIEAVQNDAPPYTLDRAKVETARDFFDRLHRAGDDGPYLEFSGEDSEHPDDTLEIDPDDDA